MYFAVSSTSECPRIDDKYSPSSSLNMFAQKVPSTRKISPTITVETSAINEYNNQTSRLNKIPATTALVTGNENPTAAPSHEPGIEVSQNFTSLVLGPGPTQKGPNSHRKPKMCSTKTKRTTVATVSPKTGNIKITTTKSSEGKRSDGHSINCSLLTFHVTVVSFCIAFSLS